jgi:histidine kinase
MATGVAHELNQPLTVIKSASNFFLKKTRAGEPIPSETLAVLAKEVDSYVDRATRIINHMREFGRQSDQEPTAVDVNAAIEGAYALLGKQFEARGITMLWELSSPLPLVMATSDQLEQVIINLLVNARDVLEEKLERGEIKQPQITIRSFLEDGNVVVQVEDNGGGISNDLIHKIFEPFFTTKKVGQGTGLGLSISYGLIQDFGGEIHAANSPDGAIFTIILPAAEA